MGKKFNIWLWLAGVGALIVAALSIKSQVKPTGATGELEKEAAWHKDKDKDEQKRLDKINETKGSREGIHDENKDSFSKKVGILLAIVFFSAAMIDASFVQEVDGELRDFGTQENYIEFLEVDREDYQKDVAIRDEEISLLKRNNTTKSNIIAIQDKELDIHRRREKPLHRLVEKVDYAAGVTIGFILALLSSKVYKNFK